ncbi:hypothetical protein ACFLX4_02965 [Chloroflexota bacterium]
MRGSSLLTLCQQNQLDGNYPPQPPYSVGEGCDTGAMNLQKPKHRAIATSIIPITSIISRILSIVTSAFNFELQSCGV